MIKIYHNPKCTKSGLTLKLLEANNISPQVILYLQDALDADELKNIAKILGGNVRDMMRIKEDIYKANNLADSSLSDDDLINAIIQNPILLERPIVVNGAKAAIGRPPENVLAIL